MSSLKERSEAAAAELRLMSSSIYVATDKVAADDISARLTRLHSLVSELAAAVPEWRPISEAPKDGTRIHGTNWRGAVILNPEKFYHVKEMWWSSDMRWWESGYRVPENPTHWRPFPTPPTDGASK